MQVLGQERVPPGWSRDTRTQGDPGRGRWEGRGGPTTLFLASASSLGPSAWTSSPGWSPGLRAGQGGLQADQVIRIWLPFLSLHPWAFPQGPQALLRCVVFPSRSHFGSEGAYHHCGMGELQPGPWVPGM